MSIDMHVHTTASDGADTPEQVVRLAASTGLMGIAITDHDTFSGVEPAVAAGMDCGIEVIPGIELSAEEEGSNVHILGYLIDMTDSVFIGRITEFRRQRRNRIEKMVNKLRESGLNVDMGRVLGIAGNGSAGRPHLAEAMFEAGLVADRGEAFTKYIGKGCVAYVPRYKLTPVEAVDMIKQAGGIPVLAHPGSGVAGQIIPKLIKAGLMGIEAGHPSHSYDLFRYYTEIGRKQNLIITGGSDYHGLERKKDQHLGMISTPDNILQIMHNA